MEPGLVMPIALTELRKGVLGWLQLQRVSGESIGSYRMSERLLPTLLSSCYAARTRQLAGELGSLTSVELSSWVDDINAAQDPTTGWYDDPKLPNLVRDALKKDEQERKATLVACTYEGLTLIESLGGRPRYPLRFLERYESLADLRDWLEKRNWKTKQSGCDILYLAFPHVSCAFPNAKRFSTEWISALFVWLEERQDPETGYWGTLKGAPLQSAFTGAFHIYHLYYVTRRPIRFMERIIDTTLSLQRQDGHVGGPVNFPHETAGVCADLDFGNVLVNLSLRTQYRKGDIHAACQNLVRATLDCLNPDGGFCDRRDASTFLSPTYLRLPSWQMEAGQSNVMATAFRFATILESAVLLDPDGLRRDGFGICVAADSPAAYFMSIVQP